MNTNKHEIIATVVRRGDCKYYKEGNSFKLNGFTPKGVCDSAYAALSRDAYALRYGAKIPWQKDENSLLTHCPDPEGATWELRRVTVEANVTAFEWDDEAQDLLKKVPFFVRKRAKKKVEEIVRLENRRHVSADDVKRAKTQFLKEIDDAETNEAAKGIERAKGEDTNEEVKLYEVTACKGKSLGCPYGISGTQELAQIIEEKLEEVAITEFLMEKISGPVLPHHRFKAAVAGCPNSCAQPQIQDFGVIVQAVPQKDADKCTQCGSCVEACREGAILLSDGGPQINRELCVNCGLCAAACSSDAITIGGTGYRVLVGGRLGRHPRLGEELAALASEAEVIEALEICVERFKSHGKSDERFSEFVERVGLDFARGTSDVLGEM